MGTSNAFGGPGNNTPLIPTWLEPETPVLPANAPVPLPNVDGQGDQNSPKETNSPVPQAPPPYRFTTARTNMTSFASSGNSVNLGRAVSHYVSVSSGGARRAARKMGSSRKTGAQLLNFLSDTVKQGARDTLQALHLENLTGLPIGEIFLGMIDYVCPDGGTIDEGIARDAFIETIADLAENGITDLDSLNSEQMRTVFELYVTHTIVNRLYNDIGTKAIQAPTDVLKAIQIQNQLFDFIQRGVADALTAGDSDMQTLTRDRVQGFVDQVYEKAFVILQSLGEMEAMST